MQTKRILELESSQTYSRVAILTILLFFQMMQSLYLMMISKNTGALSHITWSSFPISGPPRNLLPEVLTQPTNSQAIVQSSPYVLRLQLGLDQHLLPKVIQTVNLILPSNFSPFSQVRPIDNHLNSTSSSVEIYEKSFPCVEQIVHGFRLYSAS